MQQFREDNLNHAAYLLRKPGRLRSCNQESGNTAAAVWFARAEGDHQKHKTPSRLAEAPLKPRVARRAWCCMKRKTAGTCFGSADDDLHK